MSDTIGRMTEKKSPRGLIVSMFLLALVVAAAIAFFKYYEREKPQVSFLGDISTFGLTKEVQFTVSDSRSGISLVKITLSQGDKSATIYEKKFSRLGFFDHDGPKKLAEKVMLESGAFGFRDGAAELQVIVRDFSFWNWMGGNETRLTYPVTMDTRPPRIAILHSTRYVSPGGSGMVVYHVDDTVAEHGLTINGHFNPGFPVGGEEDNRFVAFFGLAYDTDKIDKAIVSATDPAGNKGKAAFGMILKRQNISPDRINISDNFLNRKIPEFAQFYPQLSGSLAEQFVYVNSIIREENYQAILKAVADPSPLRLWQGPFGRMARSSRMAGFAEARDYYYNNEKIDSQVHLGIDLASTRQAEVRAANRGNVVFADYLGIYGNTVILDHGQGIFSLYSHLSQIGVAEGEAKEKGALLGLSGATGMAGGDHLHFSILVNGIFVSPLEWWDKQWLQLNVDDILYGAKPGLRKF